MTFEQDAVIELTEDKRRSLASWVQEIRRATAEVNRLQAELEVAQAALNELTLRQVPEAMEEAGLTDLTLADGSKLVVKPDLKVNVTVANREAAYTWLRNNGHAHAVKQMLEVDLRPIPEDVRDNLLTALASKYHTEPCVTQTVHNATLKSIIADMLEKGVTIPEYISVFQFKKAIVKDQK